MKRRGYSPDKGGDAHDDNGSIDTSDAACDGYLRYFELLKEITAT